MVRSGRARPRPVVPGTGPRPSKPWPSRWRRLRWWARPRRAVSWRRLTLAGHRTPFNVSEKQQDTPSWGRTAPRRENTSSLWSSRAARAEPGLEKFPDPTWVLATAWSLSVRGEPGRVADNQIAEITRIRRYRSGRQAGGEKTDSRGSCQCECLHTYFNESENLKPARVPATVTLTACEHGCSTVADHGCSQSLREPCPTGPRQPLRFAAPRPRHCASPAASSAVCQQ